MAKKPSSPGSARDAGTGQYVTKDYAQRHPKTTVVERDKVKSGKQAPEKDGKETKSRG